MFSRLIQEVRFIFESSQQSPLTTQAVSPGARMGRELLKGRRRALSPSWAEAERQVKNTKVRQSPVDQDERGGQPEGSNLPDDLKITKKDQNQYMGREPLATGLFSKPVNVAALQNVAKALVRKKRIEAARKAAAAKKVAAKKASAQASLKFSER